MNQSQPRFNAPFAPASRGSGVLLHVTSLPCRYGIGDLGPFAIAWIDRLVDAGQSWWQVLPVGPTGFGNSPYQALSSFAANPLVISPDRLVEDELLDPSDLVSKSFPNDRVHFEEVIPFKAHILARAWQNFRSGARPDLKQEFEQFCEEKAALQLEPALFMALRAKYRETPFSEWPTEFVERQPSALAAALQENSEAIDRFRFGQFLLLRHWKVIKDYANQRGVRLLGDLPIFVAPDSADVWANPELFLLDEQRNPRFLAGVPPDYFSADGQLWGNPLYNWDVHRNTGYRWWIDRFQARLDYLDAIRIDHFRGFEAAWHVPAGSPTAAAGQWVAGPGADFFDKVRTEIGGLPFLAEDLGIITPAVAALRDQFQLPGMRVLQFAFNGDPHNPHLPHHCEYNGAVYTGTHDNDTTRGWYDSAPQQERDNLWRYAQRSPGQHDEAVWEMIRLALSSPAALAMVPLQDILGLGSSHRMNVPGRADGQWRWRCPESAFDEPAWQRLHELARAAGRAS